MPEALGTHVVIKYCVDANHAGNMANRRSHSSIIIYINTARIIWYSKRHNTAEASSFGSDSVPLRIATENIEAMWYKLMCFGVTVEGPEDIFCDNKSVFKNLSIPRSVLNKRYNYICYPRGREYQVNSPGIKPTQRTPATWYSLPLG